MDRKIQRATDRYVPTYLLRAGHLCRQAGDEMGALHYYGRAVNAYLKTGRGRQAEVVCGRIVDVKPDVVRARRTLALIALGREDPEEARHRIEEYFSVAYEAGDRTLLIKQLVVMAHLTGDGALRDRVAELLDRAGAHEDARSVATEIQEVGPTRSGVDTGLWPRAVRAALAAPADIRLS